MRLLDPEGEGSTPGDTGPTTQRHICSQTAVKISDRTQCRVREQEVFPIMRVVSAAPAAAAWSIRQCSTVCSRQVWDRTRACLVSALWLDPTRVKKSTRINNTQ